MSKKYNLVLFVILFSLGCTHLEKFKCEVLEENSKTINRLFLSLENNDTLPCLFKLQSSYFETDSSWIASFIDDKCLVSMDGDVSSVELFIRYGDSIGQERFLTVRHLNWFKGKGNEFTVDQIKVELLNKLVFDDQTYFVLKFYDVVFTDFTNSVMLDATVFFSDKRGFIGSYFSDPNFPNQIIQREGDILESAIDYTGIKFMRLR